MLRTASRTLSTNVGETESSSIAILRNVSVRDVSALGSSQIPIQVPCLWAFSALISISRRIASWCVSTDCSISGFCLSHTRVYCVRSLVPMLKKSTIGANLSLITAVAGVQIIMPSSTLSENSTPCSFNSSLTSSHMASIFSSSETLVIIGNIISRFPNTEALYNARSCVLKTSGRVRQMRIVR